MNNEYATVKLEIHRSEQLPDTAHLRDLMKKWGMQLNAQETFWVVAFDGAQNMRSVIEVARGSYSDVVVSISAILSAVLVAGTDRFMVVHNHPSGEVEPSELDIRLTQKIANAANACGLTFEDHVIIGPPDRYYSMVTAGIMVISDAVKADRKSRVRTTAKVEAPMYVACGPR